MTGLCRRQREGCLGASVADPRTDGGSFRGKNRAVTHLRSWVGAKSRNRRVGFGSVERPRRGRRSPPARPNRHGTGTGSCWGTRCSAGGRFGCTGARATAPWPSKPTPPPAAATPRACSRPWPTGQLPFQQAEPHVRPRSGGPPA